MNQFLSIEDKVECLRQEVGSLKDQLQVFLQVGEASMQSALTDSRKIMEFIVGKILLDEGLKADRELMNNIEILGGKDGKFPGQRRKDPQGPIPPPVLPAPIYSSLHNLRIYGNLVTHPWDPQTMEFKDVRITYTDLQVVLGQIMRLIEWYFQEYPKGPHFDPLYSGLPEPVVGTYSDSPPDPARFIGRATELTHLRRLLQEGKAKLITVLASAGMGKTLLAARAALDVAATWRTGQGLLLWIDLKGSPSFGEVSARILASLQAGAKPTDLDIAQQSPAARIAQVVRRMAERPILLVLDNIESWLDPKTRAAHDPHVSQLLGQMAARSHRGRVLLTSRAEVEVAGGTLADCEALRLGPLPLEDAGSLLLGQGIQGSDLAVSETWKRLGGNPRLLVMLAEVLLKRRCRNLDQGLARFPALAAGAADSLLAEVWSELSPEAQHVLQTLAILQAPVPARDLEGVLGRLFPDFAEAVEDVLWSDLVPRALVTATPEGEAFAVEHLIIRDHALRQWTDVLAAHRAALAYYQEMLAAKLDAATDFRPHLAVIHHALAAGDHDKAAAVLTGETLRREFFRQGLRP